MRTRCWFWGVGAAALLAACGGQPRDDRMESTAPIVLADRAETDLQLLRSMRDQLAGMARIAHAAEERAPDDAARDRAERIDLRFDVELDRIRRLLRSEFADSAAPTPLPGHLALADSLAELPDAQMGSTFRDLVAAHNREVIRITDGYLPSAASPRVRALAEALRARAVQELETKGQRDRAPLSVRLLRPTPSQPHAG